MNLKQLALSTVLVSSQVFSASAYLKDAELKGVFQGESANGPCTVKVTRMGDIMVLDVHQNMTDNRSLPISVKALLQKIDRSQCGGVKVNNECGSYSIEDSIQNGAGYNNKVTLGLEVMNGQRCLTVSVEDASNGEWIGQNYCQINLNRSGKNCYKL